MSEITIPKPDVSLLWRTDLHLSDFTPQSRRDDWTETLLGKIRQIGRIASDQGSDVVIDGGDFFDIKSPSRNSHRLVQAAMSAHSEYPCPVYACVGNHDCKFGDRKFLPEQPLGVLFQSGVFGRLYDEHELVIRSESVTVRVVGVPYHGVRYDMDLFRAIKKGDEDYLVVVGHVLASRKGGSMFEGEDIIKYSDLTEVCPDADVFCFGHWHKNQGIEQLKSGQWVVNVGSLSRGSLSQDNLDRIPVVVSMGFTEDGITLNEIEIEVAPAEEVFDVEGRQRAEERSNAMEAFVATIQIALANQNTKSLEEGVMEMGDIPHTVKERVISYLESAG